MWRNIVCYMQIFEGLLIVYKVNCLIATWALNSSMCQASGTETSGTVNSGRCEV